MAIPRKERAYERHAWTLLFGLGIVGLIFGVRYMILGEPVDVRAGENLTGMPWDEIVTRNPGVAGYMSALYRDIGISIFAFSTLVLTISCISYRRGERWAWYVMWVGPFFLLGITVIEMSLAGRFWVLYAFLLILSLLGLLLPYRKFFPRK